MQVNFTTIGRGDNSGYSPASQILIDSQEQWKQVWQEHTSELIPSPSLPTVDFDHEQVIAVFAGEKPTSGYAVEIVNVETRMAGKGSLPLLVLKIHHTQPRAAVQDLITHPYHIIKIFRIDVLKVTVEQV